MKDEVISDIHAKIAISLRRLLNVSKNNEINVANSYNKIALNADIRKATVSDTFNGKSVPTTATLILIIEGMGYKLADFASIYDSIEHKDIKEFRNLKTRI